MNRSGRKLLGLALLTVLGLIAFGTTSAQAATKSIFLLDGKAPISGTLTASIEESKHALMSTLGAENTPVELECSTLTLNKVALSEKEGEVSSKFTKCKVLTPEGCTVEEPIIVSEARASVLMHKSTEGAEEPYIVLAPATEGGAFTIVHFSGCILPEGVEIKGLAAFKGASTSQEAHLLEEVSGGLGLETGEGLKFGAKKAEILGSTQWTDAGHTWAAGIEETEEGPFSLDGKAPAKGTLTATFESKTGNILRSTFGVKNTPVSMNCEELKVTSSELRAEEGKFTSEFSKCKVEQPEGCKVEEPIVAKAIALAIAHKPTGGVEETYLVAHPQEGSSFTELHFSGCILPEEIGIKGLPAFKGCGNEIPTSKETHLLKEIAGGLALEEGEGLKLGKKNAELLGSTQWTDAGHAWAAGIVGSEKAEGKGAFLLDGRVTSLSCSLSAAFESKTGNIVHATFGATGKPVLMSCEKFKVLSSELRENEAKVTSEISACAVEAPTGCSVVEPIVAQAIALVVLHKPAGGIEEPYFILHPQTGAAFTTLKFKGETCLLPEEVEIKGLPSYKDCSHQLSIEQETHLLEEVNGGLGLEVGEGLKFGAKAMKILGSSLWSDAPGHLWSVQ